LLAMLALAGVQLATRVGPVVTVSQWKPPPGTQVPVGTELQVSPVSAQMLVCEVLLRTCWVDTVVCDVPCSSWKVLLRFCWVELVTCDVLCRFCAVLVRFCVVFRRFCEVLRVVCVVVCRF